MTGDDELESPCLICYQNSEDFDIVGYREGVLNNFSRQFCSSSLKNVNFEAEYKICSNCTSKLHSVMDTKVVVDKVERRVRNLQQSLLLELKGLQENLTLLEGKLEGVGDIIRNSEGSSKKLRKRNAVLFRKQVLKAVDDLSVFRNGLSTRVPSSMEPQRVNIKSEFVQDECSAAPAVIEDDYFEDDGNWNLLEESNMKLAKPSTSFTKRGRGRGSNLRKSRLSTQNRVKFREENVNIVYYDGNSLPGSENPGNTVGKGESSVLAMYKMEEFLSDAEEMDVEGNDFVYEEMYEPEVEIDEDLDYLEEAEILEDDLNERKRSKPRKLIKKSSLNSKTKKPRIRRKSQSVCTRKLLPVSDLLKNVNFDEMSEFRKHAVLLLLTQRVNIPDEDNLLGLDPKSAEYLLKKHQNERKLTYFQFSNAKPGGAVEICGIEAVINEEAFAVHCSMCSYKMGVQWPVNPDTAYSDRDRLKKNVKSHILDNHVVIYQCPLCKDRNLYNCFTYEAHLKKHLSEVQVKYDCQICGRPFQFRNELVIHLETHKSEEEKAQQVKESEDVFKKTFQCSECGKAFATKHLLQGHEKIHLDREKVVCDGCGRYFLKTYVNEHRRKYCHPEKISEDRKTCSGCGKVFETVKLRNRHFRRMHSLNVVTRPFVCEICSKSFKMARDLKCHKRTHNQEKNWQCDECGMGFTVQRYWKRHACPNKLRNGATEGALAETGKGN